MGARLTRGSSLSDAEVVQFVNENFVPVELNLSKTGFPAELPGLKPWENAYQRDWRFSVAFATSVALVPDGKYAVGTSGSGFRNEAETAANYHADLYLKFLKDSAQRASKIAAISSDTTLTAWQRTQQLIPVRVEIMKQVKAANNRGGHFGNSLPKQKWWQGQQH